jgi:predicted ribosome-associated RNA-binding protein Tma20
MDSKEIFEKRKGKAIKNLHYVGDDLWKLMWFLTHPYFK